MQKKDWILFGIVVVASAIFAYRYFDQAIPLVRVAITMDNAQARHQAVQLAKQNNFDIDGYSIATQYQADWQLQAFAELEGGGKQAFIDMIEHDYHQPYEWHVRFYKELEIKEVSIGFTPTGKPYEFFIKLPENQAGAALSKDDALQIALNGLKSWDVDVSNYELVEHHCEEMVGGRVDHLFIYERKDVSLGKGLYRLKLKVSGDLFSSLQHTVKVPDEFRRRYQQMFSTNLMIGGLARNIGFLLYLFVFWLFAFVFFFPRKHALLWQQNGKLFGVLVMIFLLNSINQWPLIWNYYQTHMSAASFIFQQIFAMLIDVMMLSLSMSAVALVAEAAGRYSFGKHIQFFRLWSSDVVGSYQVLKQTLIGYGAAIIGFGYIVGFSLFAQKLGWWMPLSSLVDPNILSTTVPCFSPLSLSFQAGFLEEFLFRALPLAGILLLTRNSRQQRLWFAIIFVVQIFIFGAVHARSYPQQPAYYRIVEMIVDAFSFGALYYYFGLLPGIVGHFVYDAVFFLLPVFMSNLWGQKLMAVLVILMPLLIVLAAWFRQKCRLKNVPDDAYNQAWKFDHDDQAVVKVERRVGNPISGRVQCGGLLLGVIGLLLIFMSKNFEINVAKITIDQSQAAIIARTAIADHFGSLNAEWTQTCTDKSPNSSMGVKYIWQTFGNDGYQKLQGSYVHQPSYAIKFVKFQGPVEDRSEVFEVTVQADGSVARVHHAIPEFWQGADISEHEAQDKAYEFIQSLYGLSRDDLELVSSKSVKHAQRRDWTIIFKDIKNYPFDAGQARVLVNIAGDGLSDIERFVHAPEEWKRVESRRLSQEGLLYMVLYLIVALWCLSFLLFAVRRFGISVRYMFPFFILTGSFIAMQFMIVGLDWYAVLYHFSTAQPFMHQIVNLIGRSLVTYLFMGIGFAVLVMSSVYFGVRASHKNWLTALPLGCALGTAMVGVAAMFKSFEPVLAPHTAHTSFSIYCMPTLAIFLHFVLAMVPAMVTLMAMFAVIELIAQRFAYRWMQPVLFICAGIVLSHSAQLSSIPVWIASGIVLGLCWYVIYRYFLSQDSDLIWIMLATIQIWQFLPSAWYGAYPGVCMQVVISGVLILALSVLAYRKI